MKTKHYLSPFLLAFASCILPAFSFAQTIAAGGNHSLYVCSDSTAMAWGKNNYGQLGNGNNTASNIPVPVSSLTGITAIAGGDDHSLALKNDGTVWAWGNNILGQLGNGTNTTSNVPVQVSALTGITAIAGGYEHSLALKNDGTVWAWGWNSSGQLGIGTTIGSNVPVQVSSLTGITAIAGGYAHSLALKNDGTVWAWGSNSKGQLGNGNNNSSTVPVLVSVLTDITAIAGGAFHSLAIKNGGSTVWAWGWNAYGALGNGNNTNSNVPVLVSSSLTGIIAIAAGEHHSLALKNDSMVWVWGRNNYGQLGNGTTTDSNVPVQVNSLTAVTAIAGGEEHSLALKNDSMVWAWGKNNYGQLGNNNNSINVPVQVTGLCQMAVAINEITEQVAASVFPNPFNSFTTIQLGASIDKAELNIFNIYGQNIKTIKNISGQAITLHRNNLSSGIYFIHVTQDNKVIASDKLVITD